MKFCYADESGHGPEPVLVVAGVTVDAARMHRTKDDWSGLLEAVERLSAGRVSEIKTRDLYRGGGWWRSRDGGERTRVIDSILAWMRDRKHAITFGAVVKDQIASARESSGVPGLESISPWSTAALHLVLSVQKHHQRDARNKGHTVFVFDDVNEKDELLGMLASPPEFTDGFYRRNPKMRQLSQLVDVPYFADSRHVVLVQVADLFAYFLRLYAELQLGLIAEKFAGELSRLDGWIAKTSALLLPASTRWPKGSSDPLTCYLRAAAPAPLVGLGPR